MMLKVVIIFFLSLTIDAQLDQVFKKSKSSNEAWHSYNGYEEPPYTSDPAFEGKGYSKRIYSSVKWVSTEYRCLTMDICSGSAFMRLFRYITGHNSDGININMTVPVLVSTSLRNASFPFSSYEMSFYIPEEHQKNPPQPTNNRVYIQTFPEMTMYTKNYAGWSNQLYAMWQRAALKGMLSNDKLPYDDNMFMVAQYNGPARMFNRRNEVWILGRNK